MGVSRGLVCRGLEVVVAQSAFASSAEYPLFSRLDHLEEYFFGLSVFYDGAYRHVKIDVCSLFASAERCASAFSAFGADDFAAFEVDEGPELGIGPEDHMASASAVTAVGAAFGDVFCPVEMGGSGSSVP